MIGPKLRRALKVAAWVLMLFGPLLTLIALYEVATSQNFALGNELGRAWVSLAVGLVSPIVQGGVLLALLSIDERIQKRDV